MMRVHRGWTNFSEEEKEPRNEEPCWQFVGSDGIGVSGSSSRYEDGGGGPGNHTPSPDVRHDLLRDFTSRARHRSRGPHCFARSPRSVPRGATASAHESSLGGDRLRTSSRRRFSIGPRCADQRLRSGGSSALRMLADDDVVRLAKGNSPSANAADSDNPRRRHGGGNRAERRSFAFTTAARLERHCIRRGGQA